MRPLAALEQFLERLFERPTTRLFRSAVQPIQIQRRIERTMEQGRRAEAGRVAVPSAFVARLNPADLSPDREASAELAATLADAVLRFARQHRYVVSERPTVALVGDSGVRRGEVDVRATTGAVRDGVVAGPHLMAVPSAPTLARDRTARYAVPQTRIPAAVLCSTSPNGRVRRHEVATAVLTIGRAPDNHVVLDDGRVSRHHARLTARAGSLVFTDLESTNGSVVNGTRVRELALGPGDRIELGRSILVVESVGAVESPSTGPDHAAADR
ncbi:MAG: FhaA domain-containing protein [Chloroflexota bacterium]